MQPESMIHGRAGRMGPISRVEKSVSRILLTKIFYSAQFLINFQNLDGFYPADLRYVHNSS